MKRLAVLADQLQQVNPGCADGWFFASIASASMGHIRRALEFVDHALELAPSNTEYLSQKARCHIQIHQVSNARTTADQGMSMRPQSALQLDTFGVVYSKTGDHGKAANAFRLAVEKQPESPQFQFNLGSAEQFLGNLDAARSAYERAIALRPDFARAHWALSELEKNLSETGRLPQLRTVSQTRAYAPEEQLYLAHAISRELERERDFQGAFRTLEIAKQTYKNKVRYDFARDQNIFNKVKSAFSSQDPAPQDERGNEVIFVLGMPRSGTTLIEQVLHNHSQIHSLGELQEFPLAVKHASASRSPSVLDDSVFEGLKKADRQAIGEEYLTHISDRLQASGTKAQRWIDKLPMNFLYLGLIAQCLPGAKFIQLNRHPLDTCLSNYRQLFSFQFAYYHYNFDLRDTARYIVEYHRLMEHWKTVFPDRIHTVSYENFTVHPEREAQSIMKFLALPWEAECLEFHRANTAVSTASSVQVRQPIYRSAVERWRKYEKELQPAVTIFEKAGLL
ncbi:tetratricopeptide repeat-containing sulfotransferase family protein [Microbulbifer pacificus]|uniref:tetratricopeptide repeat-containing sulfotransferase family protein n=1 Tax=Microbulbifer pacificus TaxID=407164 RepID=UPI00131A3354|nr:sulfotransferase [Microbulbifer pacificus]